MRTVHSSDRREGVCFLGVCFCRVCFGGCASRGCVSQGVCFPGECASGGCVSQHALRQTPLCGQNSWHTLVMILPCRNFIADGNNEKKIFPWISGIGSIHGLKQWRIQNFQEGGFPRRSDGGGAPTYYSAKNQNLHAIDSPDSPQVHTCWPLDIVAKLFQLGKIKLSLFLGHVTFITGEAR